MTTKKMLYTGKKLSTGYLNPETQTVLLHPYIPDDNLIDAVNIAIMLERPLLVMGEPGCGKSLLAHAVAFELHHNRVNDNGIKQNYKDWFFEWTIKSTSKATEGLYEYDALSRLLDVQLANSVPEAKKNAANTEYYIQERAMTNAMRKSMLDQRAILLIDEIDKADPDFPNDLLAELESGKHTVKETGRLIVENPIKPIIIITSNREKELPEAFLRRCIYYYIPPFDEDRLKTILEARFRLKRAEKEEDKPENLIEQAVEAFEKARKKIKDTKTSGKNISTSELIDWFDAIKKTVETGGNIPTPFIEQIRLFIAGKQAFLPLQQALFKNFETSEMFNKNQTPTKA